MPTYYDRIYTEAASCDGTGNITWTAAATQFALPPASVDTTVEYTLLDSGGTKWETGRATLTESGGTYTITRGGSQTVLAGSNGTSAESFTSASTHKLFIAPAAATLNAFPIANIDLDGGTDIGAALADADLILVDDGAGGTNRKSEVSRIWTYAKTKTDLPLSMLDIDSGTELGGALADADLLIVDDGAGGTNRSLLASRVRTYTNTKGTLLDMGETVKAHGAVTESTDPGIDVDVDEGHVHTATIDADCKFNLVNTTAHGGTSLTFVLTKGANSVTWGGVTWSGGSAPDISAADTYLLFFHFLGSTVYGVYGGAL